MTRTSIYKIMLTRNVGGTLHLKMCHADCRDVSLTLTLQTEWPHRRIAYMEFNRIVSIPFPPPTSRSHWNQTAVSANFSTQRTADFDVLTPALQRLRPQPKHRLELSDLALFLHHYYPSASAGQCAQMFNSIRYNICILSHFILVDVKTQFTPEA